MPEIVRDRDELLLNAIATGDATDIDPRDREEKFLKAIAEGIGSAGGPLYLHEVIGTCTDSDSHTYQIAMAFLNRSNETITTKDAIIANINYLIETEGVSNIPITFIYRLEKVTATVIRLKTLRINQDVDTKLITATEKGIPISTVTLTDTVTEI